MVELNLVVHGDDAHAPRAIGSFSEEILGSLVLVLTRLDGFELFGRVLVTFQVLSLVVAIRVGHLHNGGVYLTIIVGVFGT